MQAWNFQDLTGQRFGRLVVIKRVENSKNGGTMWLCKCDCGNETVVRAGNLKSGHTQSCGCLEKEQSIIRSTKHRKCGTRVYQEWQDMKNRCYRPMAQSYKTHGARGITVCDEWRNDFTAFCKWAMSTGYKDDLTLDRIDTNGNYEPSNCRWATPKEQANNKRSNRLITYNGKTQTLQQWADETGIKRGTLWARLKRGWNIEKALNVVENPKLHIVEYNGKKQTITQLAKEYGINHNTLQTRINRGWSVKEAVKKGVIKK